ncbi:F-box protein At5g49610-like [Triticum urartu]|nr:F-box protein At5g49610-like [Triticum urartu]
MADPLQRSLPDEISIWEILVRLPPKALLRCRAVCRAWRSATSARDFLLAHHGHQLTLPLLYGCTNLGVQGEVLDIIPFDHRPGLAAADQLQSVARLGLGLSYPCVEASCDGLLLLSLGRRDFFVCNPATRQYAPLQQIYAYVLLGMYPHSPTGEYRLLLYWDEDLIYPDLAPGTQDGSYVFTIGSGEPPRYTGYPDSGILMFSNSILFHGSLHWHIDKDASTSNMIMLFDTTSESFRQMRAPVVPSHSSLFEMDGMLGMSSFNHAATTIDIWMSQDYDSEAWALKYRVDLPVTDLTAQFGKFTETWNLVVTCWNGDVLMLIKFGEWLLQVDVDGKLVASFHRKLVRFTQFQLKQTLVPHTFFPTLAGYAVNTLPFISPDDYVVDS